MGFNGSAKQKKGGRGKTLFALSFGYFIDRGEDANDCTISQPSFSPLSMLISSPPAIET